MMGHPWMGTRTSMGSKSFGRKGIPILEIIWSDCQFLGLTGWEAHAAVMRDRGRIYQRTVGYVLMDDKKGVTLSGSYSQFGNVFGTVNIPISQIVKRRQLR